MAESGYIYILSTKDIKLPLSKIGMTTRTPKTRCDEINKSSTGDLLWQVAHEKFVDDCQQAESLLHKRLAKSRQRGREFFNVEPKSAYDELILLLQESASISEISPPTRKITSTNSQIEIRKERDRKIRAVQHEELEGLYEVFRERLGVEGRKFGQTGKGRIGISDGNEGVQWNLVVWQDSGNVELGVNLECVKYNDWPIAKFIDKEINKPTIEFLKVPEFDAGLVRVGFYRDAWQAASRSTIKERNLTSSGDPLSSLNNSLWLETLREAEGCLKFHNSKISRAEQQVTVTRKNGSIEKKLMQVSPHLRIHTTAFNLFEDGFNDMAANLDKAFRRLDEIYSWVAQRIS